MFNNLIYPSTAKLFRNLFLNGFILTHTLSSNAQVNAVTELGDQVLLYPNGTWEYLSDSAATELEITLNPNEFKKDEQASFLVKSQKTKIGIWINAKKWTFKKGEGDDVSEYEFERKGEDIYALLVSEKLEIPIEGLADIAYQNAKSAAPDIRIEKKEYRMVNDKKILMMQMSGSMSGMKITYFGYYYSNDSGTVQLLTYTGSKLFNDYLSEIELFLNGLTEL